MVPGIKMTVFWDVGLFSLVETGVSVVLHFVAKPESNKIW
jgi:hypothetical protein